MVTVETVSSTSIGSPKSTSTAFATHNYVPSNDDETQGNFIGNVQAIDDKGTIDRVFTAGLWRRDGVQLRVYGYDDDLAHRIMWVGDVDLKSKVFRAKVWELD